MISRTTFQLETERLFLHTTLQFIIMLHVHYQRYQLNTASSLHKRDASQPQNTLQCNVVAPEMCSQTAYAWKLEQCKMSAAAYINKSCNSCQISTQNVLAISS